MTAVDYRRFRAADAEPLVELISAAMPSDPVSLDWFTEYVLLDPNYDPDGLILAADGPGVVLGFVYAVRGRGTAGVPVDPTGGWITIGAVHPSARSRGIGAELLTRALVFLRDGGARWVVFSGYPPAYFLPGLDAEAYPDGFRLLSRNGFRTTSRPVAMELMLASYRAPSAVAALRAARQEDGYAFGPASAGDLPDVIAFASRAMAPDWGAVIREATVRSGRPDRVVVARDPVGDVAGFAMYGAYRGAVERFGPFGVAKSQRGRGLGTVVLHLTLARMRTHGAQRAWFVWTGLGSPAGRLYTGAGFTVTRTFDVMRADL